MVVIEQLLKLHRQLRLSLFLVLLAGFYGCAHNNTLTETETWAQSVIDYRYSLPTEHPNQVDTLFSISREMRQEVTRRFSSMQKQKAASSLARWLIDDQGHNMEYDINANLTPRESFAEQRGNCLSFTLLLTALAETIDIKIELNAVDIPDTWGLDEEIGMVFYRHVNGVLRTRGKKQVFDLAMERYDAGYPQRYISRDEALGLFLNNLAIDELGANKLSRAVHPLKLAISYSPKNPDLWANLGVVMKRLAKFKQAEEAFLFAYELNKYHVPAVSNLERFYLEQGAPRKAAAYAKKAKRARKANPYYHFQIAQSEYQKEHYTKAQRRIKLAINLHSKDPRFFELKSRIEQQQHNYRSAIESLAEAHRISYSAEQKDRYFDKAKLVSQRAVEEFKKRQSLNRGSGNNQWKARNGI